MPKRFSYESTGLVRAQARWVRSSPQKARVVLTHIRGKGVLEARALLLYSKRDVAKDIELVLRSAVANAEANHGLSPDELVVHEAFADDGVTIKRWRPRARGRATRIEKRTTHITLLLRAVEGLAPPAPEPEPEPVVEKPKRRRGKAATAAVTEVETPGDDEPALTPDEESAPDDESAPGESQAEVEVDVEDDDASEPEAQPNEEIQPSADADDDTQADTAAKD